MTDISYKLNIRCTTEFSAWVEKLDRSLRIRIDQRIQRFAYGNPGLHKRFDSVLEIKWRTGTMGSFRIYCAEIDHAILLLGGHKDTQSKDIKKAIKLFKGIQNGKTRIRIYEEVL